MTKKIVLIMAGAAAAVVGAVLGAVGLAKNAKKIRINRFMKKANTLMYNTGTVLRAISMQSAS